MINQKANEQAIPEVWGRVRLLAPYSQPRRSLSGAGGVWEPPARRSVLCTPQPRICPSRPWQTVVPAPPSTINRCRWRWPECCPGSLHPATAQPHSTHGLEGGDVQGTPKWQRVPSTQFPGHTFPWCLLCATRVGSTRAPGCPSQGSVHGRGRLLPARAGAQPGTAATATQAGLSTGTCRTRTEILCRHSETPPSPRQELPGEAVLGALLCGHERRVRPREPQVPGPHGRARREAGWAPARPHAPACQPQQVCAA